MPPGHDEKARRTERKLAIVQQFLAYISHAHASAFEQGAGGEQLRIKAEALSKDFDPSDYE